MDYSSIEISGIKYPINQEFARNQIIKFGSKQKALDWWQKVYDDSEEKLRAKLIMVLIQEIKES